MNSLNRCLEAEDILMSCVHNVRQPLGTIETSVFVLGLLLGDSAGPVSQHLRTIERQVELAARTLDEAVAELRRLRSQATEVESLAFTEPQAAAAS